MRGTLLTLLCFYGGLTAADTNIPRPTGYITDLAGVLSPETKTALETKVQAFKGNAQIAVLIPSTLQGEDPGAYAQTVFTEWGIGEKGKDNGVLLLIAPTEKKCWVQTGYGLEGQLPDILAHHVCQDQVKPKWDMGNTTGAVSAGVDAILAALTPPIQSPSLQPSKEAHFPFGVVLLVVFSIVVLLIFIALIGGPNLLGLLLEIILDIVFDGGGSGGSFGGGSSGGGGGGSDL